ncbi:MAG: hypothetical protein HUJ91_06030 [Bacteroidales bacterium]|nr:hypothetical protein [Bacteroidales bacterium]
MKKFYLAAAATATIVLSSACVNLQRLQEYEPAKVTLEQTSVSCENGALAADVLFSLPEEYYNRHTGVEFRPYIVEESSDKKIELPAVVFEGGRHNIFNRRMKELEPYHADGIKTRISYVKGSDNKYLYHLETPYETWMDGGCLSVDVIANAYTDNLLLETVPVYCGIYNLVPYVERNPIERFYYMEKRNCDDCLSTEIPFAVDSYVIDQSFYSGSFIDNFKSIVFNENVPSYKMKVIISNSPEAPYNYNETLGINRKGAVVAYFEQVGIPSENTEYNVITEDWDTIAALVADSKLPHAAEIVKMIQDGASQDGLERRIAAKYPTEYKTIFAEFFPQARVARIDICPEFQNGTGLIYNYVCDLDECTTVHTLVERKNDEIYKLNCEMMDAVDAGDFAAAEKVADKIQFNKANVYVNANRALVFFKVGRYDDSKSIYERIRGQLPEADYNLGVLRAMDGEYAAADALLSSYNDINAAIAKIGSGQYDEAIYILRLQPKSDTRDYLLNLALKCKNNNK